MVSIHNIHRVCGFCIVYKTCAGMSCENCPVHKLLEIAKDKQEKPNE